MASRSASRLKGTRDGLVRGGTSDGRAAKVALACANDPIAASTNVLVLACQGRRREARDRWMNRDCLLKNRRRVNSEGFVEDCG